MKNIFLILSLLFSQFVSFSQWTVQQSNTTNRLKSIYFVNSKIGFTVGIYGTIIKTIDGGRHWVKQESGTTNHLNSVFFTDSLTGYAVGYKGTIVYTTDGGLHWNTQISNSTTDLLSVVFVSKNVGYATGRYRTILKTENAGEIWSCTYKDSIYSNFACAFFVDSTNGYFCGQTLYKTNNGGQTYSQIKVDPGTYEPWSIFFNNKDTGYIASQYYRSIYKTIDGGNSWIKQIEQLSATGISSLFFTSVDTGYAVGGIGGEPQYMLENVLLKTSNGGNTWVSEKSPTNNALYCVYFPNANVGYACGEKGTIIKMSNSSDTIPVNDTTYTTIINKSSITILPNPAKTTISITANNKQLFQNATVSIIAINGKQVLQQTLNNDKTSIDVSTLSAGLYFVKVWNGSLCWVGRFLKE